MTTKEHYDRHLAHFYAWMVGDFQEKKDNFATFCRQHNISPTASQVAIDLGAGHGIQSIALAELGFKVIAIDFSATLLEALSARKQQLPIEIIHADIKTVRKYGNRQPELIVCCGDTLPHLATIEEITKLIADAYDSLLPGGKLLLSFRDYAQALTGASRFIPVRSDANRVLTCFLEYSPDKVQVTDLLYEQVDGQWQQKVSTYEKARISEAGVLKVVEDGGFNMVLQETTQRMVTLLAQKL